MKKEYNSPTLRTQDCVPDSSFCASSYTGTGLEYTFDEIYEL